MPASVRELVLVSVLKLERALAPVLAPVLEPVLEPELVLVWHLYQLVLPVHCFCRDRRHPDRPKVLRVLDAEACEDGKLVLFLHQTYLCISKP